MDINKRDRKRLRRRPIILDGDAEIQVDVVIWNIMKIYPLIYDHMLIDKELVTFHYNIVSNIYPINQILNAIEYYEKNYEFVNYSIRRIWEITAPITITADELLNAVLYDI